MEKLVIYIANNAVFVKEDECEIKVKEFDTLEEAENFVDGASNKVQQYINGYFLGEEVAKTKISDVQEMLKSEPDTKEAKMLGWVLGVLDNLQTQDDAK